MHVEDTNGNPVKLVKDNDSDTEVLQLYEKQARMLEAAGQAVEVAKLRLNTIINAIFAGADIGNITVIGVEGNKLRYRKNPGNDA